MEKNPYLSIMIQSLKKKSAVLDAVIELNIRQKEELENPGLDPDDFDACVEEKAKQIEQLELLDAGFQEVYDKIKADLQTNQQEYREEIAEMQEYIRRLTDKSATIQAQEARNKDLMTQKFASVRKQVKEVRKSQKVVNQYYKSIILAQSQVFHLERNLILKHHTANPTNYITLAHILFHFFLPQKGRYFSHLIYQ